MMPRVSIPSLVLFALGASAACFADISAVAAQGKGFVLKVVDADTGRPVAVRIHLKKQTGKKLIPVRVKGVPYWHDHFVVDGSYIFDLPRGHYVFELERGLEYKNYTGYFDIDRGASDEKTVEMHRHVAMSRHGWWSGDLDVTRSPDDIETIMRADDLHVATVLRWGTEGGKPIAAKGKERGVVRFDRDRYWSDLAGQYDGTGGTLRFFNLEHPLDVADGSMELIRETKRAGGHVDVALPFGWDVPLWLSARPESITLAGRHLHRDGIRNDEAGGKPRDTDLFPAPHGNGRWSEAIYYKALEAGLRIPPVAGSGSGVVPNPIGYNRAYVHCDGDFSYESWWENLRAGRVVVTNGPLLRPNVEGELPGHTFQAESGEAIELEIGLTLSMREKVDYLEVVKNGRPAITVRLDEFARAKGRLPKLTFDESGWFLIRAVTNNATTYRYASTGPYYVEIGYKPRTSREAVQFFLDWIDERTAALKKHGASDDETLREWAAARQFWEKRLAEANAD